MRYHFPVSIVNEENVQVEDSATISSQFPSVETILQNNKNKYGKIEWACVEEKCDLRGVGASLGICVRCVYDTNINNDDI